MRINLAKSIVLDANSDDLQPIYLNFSSIEFARFSCNLLLNLETASWYSVGS
jgi:hypothetical protein